MTNLVVWRTLCDQIRGLVTCRMALRGISEVDPNGKTRVLTRMGLHIPSCRRVCVSDMEDTANKWYWYLFEKWLATCMYATCYVFARSSASWRCVSAHWPFWPCVLPNCDHHFHIIFFKAGLLRSIAPENRLWHNLRFFEKTSLLNIVGNCWFCVVLFWNISTQPNLPGHWETLQVIMVKIRTALSISSLDLIWYSYDWLHQCRTERDRENWLHQYGQRKSSWESASEPSFA